MNKNDFMYNSGEELSGKQLYQRSFNNQLRGAVQPNIGRIQQAGAESYRASYLAGLQSCIEHHRAELSDLLSDAEVSARDFPGAAYRLSLMRWLLYRIPSETDFRPSFLKWSSIPLQRPVGDSENFLDRARRLDKAGNTDAALDLIYESVNGKLSRGRFKDVDAVLQTTEPWSLSVDLMLGLLTSTLPARTKLPSRGTFFQKSEAAIKDRKEWEDGLLTGLEN